MPGTLLHVGATVSCAHAGQAQPTIVNPRVTVSGQPIVTQTSTYAIAACSLATVPSPACATAQWTTAALRVKASGLPVLLQDSLATCVPTGTPLAVLVTQLRVRGI